MATLTVQSDTGEEKFSLDAPSVTLGRGLECDIRLKDIKSSRRHCQVLKGPDGYKLVELGSGNGTFVNGILIHGEHRLRSGDNIQIGECVIVFSDGSGGKAPTVRKAASEEERKKASSPTSRVPAVPPGTTRVTSRMTSGPPTAATKRTAPAATAARKTDRVPAAAAPQTKPATNRVPTSAGGATTRRGATTANKPPTTHRTTTSRSSAVDRYTADAGKKKKNPMVFVIAGGAAAVAGIIVLILVFAGGGNDLKFDQAQIKELTGKAAKALEADKFDEAIGYYEEAIKRCEKHKELKSTREQLKKSIEEANTDKKLREEALVEWTNLHREYLANAYSQKEGGTKEMETRADKLKKAHQTLNRPWTRVGVPCVLDKDKCTVRKPDEIAKISEFDRLTEVLAMQVKEEIAQKGREGFQAKRNAIIKQYITSKEEEDFAGQIKAWTEYKDTTKDAEGRQKSPGEIVKVNQRANEAWEKILNRINGKTKEEALEILRRQQPRFQGCKVVDDSGSVVRDIEKEIADKIAELEK